MKSEGIHSFVWELGIISKVKFPADRSSYNARSTIFLIVSNLLIAILSSFFGWIQALSSLLPIKLAEQTCFSQHKYWIRPFQTPNQLSVASRPKTYYTVRPRAS